MTKYMTATHWGAYQVEVENGQVSALTPFDHDPDPSPIGLGMPQALSDAVRIRQPMVRKAWLEKGRDQTGATPTKGRGKGPFVAVSWERAWDLAADELERVRTTFGNQAIYAGSYGWGSAGRFHHPSSHLHRFMKCAGGYTDSINTYSFAAGEVILPHVIGLGMFQQIELNTPLTMVAEHTELLVSFGGIPMKNTQVDGGGTGKHGVKTDLLRCRDKGVRFVSFSPLKSDMADFLTAEWRPLRPNTDTALMMGLAHELVSRGKHSSAFLESHCIGFERFEAYLVGKTDGVPKNAEWAGAIAGVAPNMIRDLATEMSSKRTMINLSWSTQRTDHGEQAFWMAITLAAILGQIGLPGGGFALGYGATNLVGRAPSGIPKPALPQGENLVRDYIPVARISDMLLNPGEQFVYDGEQRTYPDIKIVYWCGGNPFHHHQDLNKMVEAWQKPDTVIVHEAWWNANARHADIIFPMATTLERNDIGVSRTDSYFFAMQKAAEPYGDTKTDYEIFTGLAARLDCELDYTEGRNAQEWLEHMFDRLRQNAAALGEEMPSLEEFWERGYHKFSDPEGAVFMSAFRKDPIRHALGTPSGKIEIFSEKIDGFGYLDCPGHPVWQEPAEWLGADLIERFPLHLISNQPDTRLHSQYDNGGYSQSNKLKGREPATMNPDDAARRNIEDGDAVRLFNDRGACLSVVKLSDGVMPGVIRLPTGAWFDPLEPGEPGSLDVHGNPNVLTRDVGTSSLAQGPTAMSTLVQVEKFEGALPPIKIFTPPEVIPEEGL